MMVESSLRAAQIIERQGVARIYGYRPLDQLHRLLRTTGLEGD